MNNNNNNNNKRSNSQNPTLGKKKYIKPIWFPEDVDENESPTARTKEKPFSDKNINHKW